MKLRNRTLPSAVDAASTTDTDSTPASSAVSKKTTSLSHGSNTVGEHKWIVKHQVDGVYGSKHMTPNDVLHTSVCRFQYECSLASCCMNDWKLSGTLSLVSKTEKAGGAGSNTHDWWFDFDSQPVTMPDGTLPEWVSSIVSTHWSSIKHTCNFIQCNVEGSSPLPIVKLLCVPFIPNAWWALGQLSDIPLVVRVAAQQALSLSASKTMVLMNTFKQRQVSAATQPLELHCKTCSHDDRLKETEIINKRVSEFVLRTGNKSDPYVDLTEESSSRPTRYTQLKISRSVHQHDSLPFHYCLRCRAEAAVYTSVSCRHLCLCQKCSHKELTCVCGSVSSAFFLLM